MSSRRFTFELEGQDRRRPGVRDRSVRLWDALLTARASADFAESACRADHVDRLTAGQRITSAEARQATGQARPDQRHGGDEW